MAWREVYSSSVDAVDYENGTLRVMWKNGKISAYAGVPERLAGQVMNAPSIGQALRSDIIGVYGHEYIEE